MPRMNLGAGLPVRHVKDRLLALAEADRRVTVPADVGASVMRSWDAAHPSTASIRPARAWPRRRWLIAAAAAAAVLLAAAARTRRPDPRPLEASRVPAMSNAAPAARQTARAAAVMPAATPARRASGRTPEPRRSTTRPDEVGLILIADPMFDSSAATVIRVRMPRSALASIGLPIAEPDAAGAVEVEMLVGEDGIARSIRRATAAPANPDQE